MIVIDENQENSSIYTQLIKSHGARTSCHVKSLGSYRVQICINPLSTMYISLSCFQVKLLQYYTSKMIIYKRAGAHRNFSNLKAKLLEFQLYMSVLRSSDQKFKFRNFELFLCCEIGNNMSTKLKWVTSEMAHLDWVELSANLTFIYWVNWIYATVIFLGFQIWHYNLCICNHDICIG